MGSYKVPVFSTHLETAVSLRGHIVRVPITGDIRKSMTAAPLARSCFSVSCQRVRLCEPVPRTQQLDGESCGRSFTARLSVNRRKAERIEV